MFTYKDIFSNKKRVLFVTAHPDDIDVFFGGSVCLLNKDKKEVFVLVVTNGARGSRENDIAEQELAKTRYDEEVKALKILGLAKDKFITLNYLDGEVENSFKLIGQIARAIRSFRPDAVCTHDPQGYFFQSSIGAYFYINHRDHRNTGASTLDAVYPFSRDRSFFREHLQEALQPHTVMEILLTPDSTTNTKVDITKVVAQKRMALSAHKTQFDEKTVEEILSFDKEGTRYFEKMNYLRLGW